MKTSDRYLTFIRWSVEDAAYVGYCPDLFPAGGVCHADDPVSAFAKLYEIVEDTVSTAEAGGVPLPSPNTRPMRELDVELDVT